MLFVMVLLLKFGHQNVSFDPFIREFKYIPVARGGSAYPAVGDFYETDL